MRIKVRNFKNVKSVNIIEHIFGPSEKSLLLTGCDQGIGNGMSVVNLTNSEI